MNQNNQKKQKKSKNSINDYAKYSGLAFQMVAIIGLGVFGGIKLDSLLKIDFPVFTVTFSLVSVVLAIYLAIKDFIKMK